MQSEINNISEVNNFTPCKRWLITAAVMLATLMQVLDTTIVNVALPHMQGSLGATSDQISWTLTVYLVASGVFMPLTGYFSDFFGRKKYLLICILGFTVISAFCGLSQNLTQIVFFRILQGIFGAGLVPLSQAILTDVYPKEEIGKAMAIWGAGIMVGPVLGPTLGGYITEVLDWRWTFYINVPVGIFALIMAWRVVPDTLKKIRNMDWIGLVFLALAVGSFQYLLDRGNQLDWFNSINIKIAVFLTIFGLAGFFMYSLQNKEKMVFDLRIFKDLNFTIASLLLVIVSVGLYGGMVLLPIILENLFNYPVLTTGLVMAPRGISGMLSMILVSKLIKHFSPRLLIIIGILFSVAGLYPCTHYSLTIDKWWFIWPMLLQGFGLGMIFVPLSVVGFSTLPDELKVDASGLFSLLRTIGSSMGIAIIITIFTRHTQMAWNHLSGFIHPYNSTVYMYLQHLHLLPNSPKAAAVLGNVLAQQSQMLSAVNTFSFIMWSFISVLPFLLLFRSAKNKSPIDIQDISVKSD